jgi:hypothetical protein
MTPSQATAKLLNEASAITNIVSTRIYFGNRPDTTIMPCINFYELPGGQNSVGFQRIGYSINCRAITAETVLTLAREVDYLFNGTSGTGIYGYASNVSVFGFARAFTQRRQGLIPEPDNGGYNAPVDIFMVFPNSSIS